MQHLNLPTNSKSPRKFVFGDTKYNIRADVKQYTLFRSNKTILLWYFFHSFSDFAVKICKFELCKLMVQGIPSNYSSLESLSSTAWSQGHCKAVIDSMTSNHLTFCLFAEIINLYNLLTILFDQLISNRTFVCTSSWDTIPAKGKRIVIKSDFLMTTMIKRDNQWYVLAEKQQKKNKQIDL